jgi:hypothetical protein
MNFHECLVTVSELEHLVETVVTAAVPSQEPSPEVPDNRSRS